MSGAVPANPSVDDIDRSVWAKYDIQQRVGKGVRLSRDRERVRRKELATPREKSRRALGNAEKETKREAERERAGEIENEKKGGWPSRSPSLRLTPTLTKPNIKNSRHSLSLSYSPLRPTKNTTIPKNPGLRHRLARRRPPQRRGRRAQEDLRRVQLRDRRAEDLSRDHVPAGALGPLQHHPVRSEERSWAVGLFFLSGTARPFF